MDAQGCLQQRLTLSFRYPVHFCRDLFAPANPLLADTLGRSPRRPHRVALVLDGGLAAAVPQLAGRIAAYAAAHADTLELVGEPLLLPGGEAAKRGSGPLRRLLRHLARARIDRHGFLLAAGGGALLDVAGLAAALTHRGVRLVRLPTTVLAQNDAAVGVKNGINAFGAKNFLGSFAPPFAVLADFDLLATLPARERIAGLAEAVKVALIRDAAFFEWLEGHAPALRAGEPEPTARAIRRCAELHLAHIAEGGDPFELGSARPLDFGHWAAHRLEQLTGHALRHGEAVAIGMAIDSRYALLKGLLAAECERRIRALLTALGLPIRHPLLADEAGRAAVSEGLEQFREHLGGGLCLTLLTDLGRGREVEQIDPATLQAAMASLATEREGACASTAAI